MRRILPLIFVITPMVFFGQDAYNKAWEAIGHNKWSDAESLLETSEKDGASFEDSYITHFYLRNYLGKNKAITDYQSNFFQKAADPFPYTYALWFDGAVIGASGKKTRTSQVSLLEEMAKDKRTPGTMVAACNYQLGMHQLFSANFNKTQSYFDKVGSIHNWSLVGPFENISESGHDKDYGPPGHPEADAVFYSQTNAAVKWFTPAAENPDGWTPVSYSFGEETAVVYAQTFVTSTEAQQLFCNLGVSGAVKIWINDELMISEVTERLSEFDVYRVPCKLAKGPNRVLVQLGFTNNSYANFCVRFTDAKGVPVSGLTSNPTPVTYPKVSNSGVAREQVVLFAEQFFLDKIKKQPSNLVNYLLLADVYLRNKKVVEARDLMSSAEVIAPDNCLVIMKMIEVLIKENNRTLLLEEVERLKQLDPDGLVVIEIGIKEFFDNEKYDECRQELARKIQLYGEDYSAANYKLRLMGAEKKYDDLVTEVERQFKLFPDNEALMQMMYAVKKEVYKDKKGAIKLYESYMDHNYSYGVTNKYREILEEEGQHKKAREVTDRLLANFPFTPAEFSGSAGEYFNEKQYDKAEQEIKKAISIAPYSEAYWERLGDIRNEKKMKDEAISAYNESLRFNPNQYEIINKIRKLNDKPELYQMVPESNIDSVVRADKMADAKNADYGYYYILDQKDAFCYPGGANEQYYLMLIRITNQKGIDRWKESSVGYGNSQSLLIEKAEIIKKNMSHIKGEINSNEVVFPKLEAGDVVVFKYRLREYHSGRMAREFWDQYFFGGQIYSARVRYNLVMPASTQLYYEFRNDAQKPEIKEFENFKQYTWESRAAEPDKEEPLMPVLTDISRVLHVSTIPDWKLITDWYADISTNRAEEDFEIRAAYKQLFPEPSKPMSQYAKARKIYDYIEANISYSSVAFRQSGYVPQRPAKTLNTKLGDCKDLSSLFVTLAQMAGIKAQLVLLDTRNNGLKHIVLPSMEFNHCIVKAELDKKTFYLELTDNYLPFACLPNTDLGANILEIPYRNSKATVVGLKALASDTRTKDVLTRVMDIRPSGADIDVTVQSTIHGTPGATTRYNFQDLDEEKTTQQIQETVAGRYKSLVNVSSVKFGPLEQRDDSVTYSYTFKAKNEIAEIGSMKTFRVNYPDVVASLDNFSSETRIYPVNYTSYEDADRYETTVNITAPAGAKFIELPQSQSFSFNKMTFAITYTVKAPNKLVITRKFNSNRENLAPSQYAGLKAFFEKIVKAEQAFITYK